MNAAAAPLPQPVNILLVEDDEIDAEAVARILRKQQITNPLFHARDGIEALELLREKKVSNIPCLVLLDINMPRMDGFHCLAETRKAEPMNKNVVYILTTSTRDADRRFAMGLDAAGYLLKQNPAELEDILTAYCKPKP